MLKIGVMGVCRGKSMIDVPDEVYDGVKELLGKGLTTNGDVDMLYANL